MIVVDIETSGTNASKHGILVIGAIDTLDITRTFEKRCRLFDGGHIDLESLKYNGFDKVDINDKSLPSEEEIVRDFLRFAMKSDDHTLAGHNPIFDISFIIASCQRWGIDNTLASRTIDMHSVCVAHLANRGKEYPVIKNRSALDDDSIMEYVGIPCEPKPHISPLDGARHEAEALSRMLYNKNLLPEFKEYRIRF